MLRGAAYLLKEVGSYVGELNGPRLCLLEYSARLLSLLRGPRTAAGNYLPFYPGFSQEDSLVPVPGLGDSHPSPLLQTGMPPGEGWESPNQSKRTLASVKKTENKPFLRCFASLAEEYGEVRRAAPKRG